MSATFADGGQGLGPFGHLADDARPALGLSIGATTLAAVTAGRAVTRKPVLTLYRDRPPEVGVPSENPRIDRPGVVVTDFVSRVGEPAGIVAADGSVHRGEALLADALRALAYTASGGRALPEHVAVTYPAHWETRLVDTLGAALGAVAEWSDRARPLLLIPDAAAALFAVRADPGIPAGGTVAVCDFGGRGTSITLMDAGDYHALAPTVRHHDFSGQLIDQLLVTAVMANLPGAGTFGRAIGSLSRLRAGCRNAKEQLSSSAVATVADEVRLSRKELDDAIRAPLNNFVTVVEKTLAGNGIRDLAAVVAVGGGANVPAVITALSRRLRVPIVTTPRPQLAAAVGGALRAAPAVADHHPSRSANYFSGQRFSPFFSAVAALVSSTLRALSFSIWSCLASSPRASSTLALCSEPALSGTSYCGLPSSSSQSLTAVPVTVPPEPGSTTVGLSS